MTVDSNTAQQKFNHAVKTLLNPKTELEIKISNSLFSFIRIKINQTRLKGYVEIKEVISESYLRGIKYIENKGEEIRNADAFIKATSVKVLLEMSRKRKRSISLNSVVIEEGWKFSYHKEERFSERLSENQKKRLRLFFNKLSSLDYIIFYLLFVKGFKAKEVVNVLEKKHAISESNVRQKRSRILKRIRKEMEHS